MSQQISDERLADLIAVLEATPSSNLHPALVARIEQAAAALRELQTLRAERAPVERP